MSQLFDYVERSQGLGARGVSPSGDRRSQSGDRRFDL